MICRVLPLAVPVAGPPPAPLEDLEELDERDDELDEPEEPSSGYSMNFVIKYRGGAVPPPAPELDELDELEDEELDDVAAVNPVYLYWRMMIGRPHCPCWINSPETNALTGS